MRRLKILLLFLFACYIGGLQAFGQDSLKSNNYLEYKNSVESLYEDVMVGTITQKDALKELNNLKKKSYSTMKEFSKILDEKIPALINRLNKIIQVDSSITYTVQAGDNLWSIAQKTLKNSFKWLIIYNANKDKIPHPDVIHPGQKLVIPVIVSYLTQNNSASQNNTAISVKKDSTKKPDSLAVLKNFINNLENKAKNQEKDDSGINGLIVDQTDSKIGHDFYDIFYSNWQSPKNMKDYTITITEKPLPQLGTQITILINDSPIFQRFIQPRYEIIEQMAQQGAATAYSYLENYSNIQKQLQGEDLKGTGIF